MSQASEAVLLKDCLKKLRLPAMGRDLAISIEDSRWVVQAFLLAVGVLLLVAGRVSDLVGHRRVYLIGFLLFGATSLACGMAVSKIFCSSSVKSPRT